VVLRYAAPDSAGLRNGIDDISLGPDSGYTPRLEIHDPVARFPDRLPVVWLIDPLVKTGSLNWWSAPPTPK